MSAAAYIAVLAIGYAHGRYRPWKAIRDAARMTVIVRPDHWAHAKTLLALVVLADELAVAYWRKRRHPEPQRRPVPALIVRPNRSDQ